MSHDRFPSSGEVAGLVRAVLGTELPVRSIEEGGEHPSWWVGDRYVARFAVGEDGVVRQRREIAVRDLVRAHTSIAVPASVGVGAWAHGTFTLDTRLPGESGETASIRAAGEADLARLLADLRSIPLEKAAALGLPDAPPPEDADEAVRWLAGRGELDTSRLPAPPGSGQRIVLHNDLKGEHLRVTEDGRVIGVLDWADAAIGDPAADVAGIVLAIGAAAAARVAASAGYPDDVAERGIVRARRSTALLLAERLQGRDDSPLPLLRAQLARAWEDGVRPPG